MPLLPLLHFILISVLHGWSCFAKLKTNKQWVNESSLWLSLLSKPTCARHLFFSSLLKDLQTKTQEGGEETADLRLNAVLTQIPIIKGVCPYTLRPLKQTGKRFCCFCVAFSESGRHFIHVLFSKHASAPFHSAEVLTCLKLILFYNTRPGPVSSAASCRAMSAARP